ncbi:MAG: hypothetical protein KZQ89_05780 [Candidatus Thiodiazotropha sp. (ex Lucinoma kastoroae)]|nr:hypothetical protein [Candidatus Thiodiazotropha sp. (ex Lucinoma kastoroae)]MCU7861253.1 hypothetical protein [Candidatus Thiodiazotropha sp. (ex Lucinoma kastoroae)]
MTISTFPEDSVLKRHVESDNELKRQIWLQTPPTDSVLRRHHITSLKYHSSMAHVATPSAVNPSRKPIPAQVTAHTRVQAKGLFGWLRNLFN